MRFTVPDTLERREMTRWFHPMELLRTAFHALFSTTITGYIDRRETLAALHRRAARSYDHADEASAAGTETVPESIWMPGDESRHPHDRVRALDRVRDNDVEDVWQVHGTDEIWLDFAADVGDGFDPTYALALLLAEERLPVRGLEGGVPCTARTGGTAGRPRVGGARRSGTDNREERLRSTRTDEEERTQCLPRADLLVLGGDLVYPTPARDEYRIRLRQPMEAALPSFLPESGAPSLFAIPGNHDWYDGLTNFVREFCQGGWIGGWRLWQRRSYFAVRLMPGWWLWGIDVQLATRIDPPQLAYFRSLVQKGDRIILCTARPSWYDADAGYSNLQFFEDRIIRANGASVALVLSGDVHHYARYSRAAEPPAASAGNDRDARQSDAMGAAPQRITAGAGGSYLRGTHGLRETLRVAERRIRRNGSQPAGRDPASGPRTRADRMREATYVLSGFPYPSPARSRRLALRALAFPLLLRNTAWFCLLLGTVYALLAGLLELQPAPGIPPAPARWSTLLPFLRSGYLALVLFQSASATIVVALVCTVLATFAVMANTGPMRILRGMWGAVHGVAHVASVLIVVWLVNTFAPEWILGDGRRYYPAIALAGALVGGFLFGLYLVVSDLLFGWHENEAFACQSIPDHRCFIRMRIDRDGIDVYPIGLRRVPRRWARKLRHDDFESVLEPTDGTPLEPHLIEGPIRITVP